MGKSERPAIKIAEEIVTKLINNKTITYDEMHNKHYHNCIKCANLIKADFQNIKIAEHSGDEYSTIGDIKLELDNGEIKYIELKFLDENSRFGTLANISQNALTNLGIITGMSWADFRKSRNFETLIITELNKHPNIKINAENYKKTEIYAAGDIINKDLTILAMDIKNQIKTIAEKDKKDYISYIITQKIDYDKLKSFVIFLLIGYHTEDDLLEKINCNLLDFQSKIRSKNYEIYYIYPNNIIKEDFKYIEQLLVDKLKLKYTNGTNLLVSGEHQNYIRIVFNWKNKFQGIQTPCLNIFKE